MTKMRKSMVFEGVTVTLLILLLFLMLTMILSGNTQKEISGFGNIRYTYIGSDNTLYVFSDDTINAIGENGKLSWTFSVPKQWSLYDNESYLSPLNSSTYSLLNSGPTGNPSVSSSNGVLYVYMEPKSYGPPMDYINGTLMAIAGGKVLWSVPIMGHTMIVPVPAQISPYSYYLFGEVKVYASDDKVYVFHDYNETIIDENGAILGNIGNVTDPAAVDDLGRIYCVRSIGESHSVTDYPYNVYMHDYREPSSIVDAYYPNGTLMWENYTTVPMVRPSLYGLQSNYTLPLYHNGMLYAPLNNGITSMSLNGTVKWTKTYDPNLIISEISTDYYEHLVELGFQPALTGNLRPYITPFDSKGDVYLQSEIVLTSENSPSKMLLITVGPDGNELSKIFYNSIYQVVRNGIGYGSENYVDDTINDTIKYPYIPSNLTSLDTGKVIAFNISTGEELWNYTFRANANDTVVTTIDADNVRSLVDSYTADEAINDTGMNISQRPRHAFGLIMSETNLQISPGDNVVYVYYQSKNYDDPIVLGKSKCAYYSGLYAFSLNGTLLWSKSIPPVQPIQITQNGTMFYQTPDGKVGVTGAGVAAGFTLTALIYLFIRFFCVGAVARAKASLDKNEKRNLIYDYIAKNPGLTMYEIARNTGVNLGTARYHVFILGMNHKITSYRTNGKYIRYFTNSNSYSKEEQLILSVMRRDAIGKVLVLLLKNPRMSSSEIADELGIQESAVCRCIKELSEKGIIKKEPQGCLVDDVQRERINTAIKRMNLQ